MVEQHQLIGQNNELIKDGLIVPPASTIDEARERSQKYKCYDWWMCYEEEKIPREEVEEVKKWMKRILE